MHFSIYVNIADGGVCYPLLVLNPSVIFETPRASYETDGFFIEICGLNMLKIV